MSRSFAAYDLLDKFSVPFEEISEQEWSKMTWAEAVRYWMVSVRYIIMHFEIMFYSVYTWPRVHVLGGSGSQL